jgi:hypothetical protein
MARSERATKLSTSSPSVEAKVILKWAKSKGRGARYRVKMATASTGLWKAVAGCAGAIRKPRCTATGLANIKRTTDKAAHAARGYTGGGKTDWFLPSTDETNLERQYAAGAPTPPLAQCALSAATCAAILDNVAPATAKHFGRTVVSGGTKAIGACGGSISPILIVPAAAGLLATVPHDGSGTNHCVRQASAPAASPQVRPVRAFH